MNQITIVGYVGRDADLSYTPQGTAVAKFSIADSTKHGDKEETTWYNITAWNKLAEIAAQYVKKGTQVLVIGVLTPRGYTGRDGTAKTSMDVTADKLQMLGKKAGTETTESRVPVPAGAAPADAASSEFPF